MIMFAGLGAASAAVVTLQQALVAVAQRANAPAMNPGGTSGEVTPQTITAIIEMMRFASRKIPEDKTVKALKYTIAGIEGASILAPTKSADLVRANATYFTYVARTLNVAIASGALDPNKPAADGGDGGGGGGGAMTVATPWYTTPMGVAGIVIGALLVYKLVLEPRRAA